MKVKIQLSNSEFEAIPLLLGSFKHLVDKNVLLDFMCLKAIDELMLAFTTGFMKPSKCRKLSLTGLQIYVFYEFGQLVADMLQPFEQSLILKIIEAIDHEFIRQKDYRNIIEGRLQLANKTKQLTK